MYSRFATGSTALAMQLWVVKSSCASDTTLVTKASVTPTDWEPISAARSG